MPSREKRVRVERGLYNREPVLRLRDAARLALGRLEGARRDSSYGGPPPPGYVLGGD